jgi:hypothetical protein
MDAPAPLYLPLLHWEHEVVPEDEDVPAAHSRQLVASVLAYLPAGQLEQDVAPSE